EPLPVVGQAPTPGVRRAPLLHGDDEVGKPRPGVLAVEIARPRRMVGMRMVITHHVGARGAGLLVGRQHRLGLDHVPVVAAVLPLVLHRQQALDGRGLPGGAADEEAAALLRKSRLAVAADRLQVAGLYDETAHQISSSQKRSDRYLSAPSHRTVTTV